MGEKQFLSPGGPGSYSNILPSTALMPDRSQRSGRTKGSNRAYLLLIKQKAP